MNYGLKDIYINKINSVFAAFPEVEKVVLYGSRAKGNYRTGSDIDLVVFGNDITYKTYAKISLFLDDLLIPYKVDLALFNKIVNEDIKEHIDRVGKSFYIKN